MQEGRRARRQISAGGAFGRAALLAALLLAAGPVWAADTGLVVLKNGDRIKGEVKGLRVAKLELSTSSMGTIYIEWDKVREITAPEYFEVETSTGSRHFGTLAPGPQATLGVTLDGQSTNLDLLSVVQITPIKQSFWSRVDGAISLGASYTDSSGIGQGTLSASVGGRRTKFNWATKLDTTVTVQPDQPDKTRTMYTLAYNRILPERWLVLVSGRAEHNSDLGLQLRAAYGLGLGRYVTQTNRSLFQLGAGLTQNIEIPVDGDRTSNVEAFVGARYAFFTYDTPKTNVSAAYLVYPSLSVGGRVRTDADLTLSREIVSDFTVGLTFYDSFDNKPPGENGTKHDFGVTLSIGWVF